MKPLASYLGKTTTIATLFLSSKTITNQRATKTRRVYLQRIYPTRRNSTLGRKRKLATGAPPPIPASALNTKLSLTLSPGTRPRYRYPSTSRAPRTTCTSVANTYEYAITCRVSSVRNAFSCVGADRQGMCDFYLACIDAALPAHNFQSPPDRACHTLTLFFLVSSNREQLSSTRYQSIY